MAQVNQRREQRRERLFGEREGSARLERHDDRVDWRALDKQVAEQLQRVKEQLGHYLVAHVVVAEAGLVR